MRGINTKAQLARAEAVMQQRLRQAALEAGVTLIAPETVFLCGRHQARPRRHGRAVCRVRPGRHGRGRRDDPLVLASRRRACRQGRDRRPVRAAAAGREARRGRARRQFRRGQGGDDRGRRQGQPPDLYRRRAGSARAPISAPAPSPATTTAPPSTAPTSARAPSSARIRRWWRRSRSATAPMSARARSSPRTCRPTRWRSAARRQTVKEGWAKRLRQACKAAGKKKAQKSVKPVNRCVTMCQLD